MQTRPSRASIARPPAYITNEVIQESGKQVLLRTGPIEPRKGGIPNEELEKRISHRLDLIHGYLNDETFMGRLEHTSLKDITVAEAIQLDKLMALRGQPSIIVGHTQHKKLDELTPALLGELKKRGMKATLTERQAVIDIDSE